MMDLSKRSGDLIPVRELHNGMMRYRCVRIRVNGKECGNVRDVARDSEYIYFYCVECASLLQNKRTCERKPKTVKQRFMQIRESFTREQWQLYYEILRGRTSQTDQREAVDLVLLELKAA